VGLEAKPESEKDIDPRQVVTLIAGLRAIPVGEAITAVQGLAFPGRGPSANIPVVQVPTGNLLLVEVPYEQIPYLRGLLLELDRRAEEAGRRLEVVNVRTGKPDVLAAVIDRILEGRAAARSAAKEKAPPPLPGTRVVPHPDSRSIVIDAASEEDLRWIRELIGKLDVTAPEDKK
jgi:type II secretory pathway component GspD/PulD (secretin)